MSQKIRWVLVLLAVAQPAPGGSLASAQQPAPRVISPGQLGEIARIADTCPTFSWASRPGAVTCEVVVYRLTDAVDLAQPDRVVDALPAPVLRVTLPGGASSWTPSLGHCLDPAPTRYAWLVRDVDRQGREAWSEARLFEVADPASLATERVLERLLERFLEQRRIDAATASALRADPTLLLAAVGPPPPEPLSILDPIEQTALTADLPGATPRLVSVLGTTSGLDGSSGVRGEAVNAGAVQTYGVVGLTSGSGMDSAGVLGESQGSASSEPKYGVLGISNDSNAKSAGVAGRGEKGVLGVGGSLGLGVIGTTEDQDLGQPPPGTGVLGVAANNGVIGVATGGTGRGGSFTGGASGLDVELGSGKIGLAGGLSQVRFLASDASTPAEIAGNLDASLVTIDDLLTLTPHDAGADCSGLGAGILYVDGSGDLCFCGTAAATPPALVTGSGPCQ